MYFVTPGNAIGHFQANVPPRQNSTRFYYKYHYKDYDDEGNKIRNDHFGRFRERDYDQNSCSIQFQKHIKQRLEIMRLRT